MRALKYLSEGQIEVVDEPDPVPGAGEVVVDVAFAGICGSDLHGFLPGGYRTPPLIMGHEFSALTPDGRPVTVNATLSCGACDLCLAGRVQLCRNREILGIQRAGGFAEKVAVPERALVELSRDTSLEAGALVEPLAVAIRGWKRSRAGREDRVAILGAGNIGLLLLAVGVGLGHEITITDPDQARAEMARTQGAAHVGASLEGEYDVIFDAVGSLDAHVASLRHLRPGGTAVWIGSRSPDPGYDALDLVRSEKSVIASFAYTDDDFNEAARLAASLSLDWVVTVPLEHSAEVFKDLVEGRSVHIKVLIDTRPAA